MRDAGPEAQLVKIQFYDPEVGYENIWALPLGNGAYQLENPPFFIYDIAAGDAVAAVADADGVLQFLRVVSRSGNRTLRARSDDLLRDARFKSRVFTELGNMRCQTEAHGNTLLSINIPPDVDLATVERYLTAAGLNWEYGFPAELNT